CSRPCRARHGGGRAGANLVRREPRRRHRMLALGPVDPELPALRRRRRRGDRRMAAPEPGMSGNWQAFDDEVARWRDAGRRARLWWRDDDAADVSAALDRLLELQRQTAVPLALAVVPAQATDALAERLAGMPAIDVLQ